MVSWRCRLPCRMPPPPRISWAGTDQHYQSSLCELPKPMLRGPRRKSDVLRSGSGAAVPHCSISPSSLKTRARIRLRTRESPSRNSSIVRPGSGMPGFSTSTRSSNTATRMGRRARHSRHAQQHSPVLRAGLREEQRARHGAVLVRYSCRVACFAGRKLLLVRARSPDNRSGSLGRRAWLDTGMVPAI